MCDRAPENNAIRRAMDACLPRLENEADFERMVLKQVRGEIQVKKKLSVGFVLVIVLVLATVTALAAALLWEQQVIPMKEIEQMEGDYMDWPIGRKEVLIQALIDSDNIAENSDTARLFDDATAEEEKHTIADQLVLTLTGQTDPKEITVDIITYAIMGSEDTWTPEQRVWWQEVTRQFYGTQGSSDTFVTPNGTEPTEAEAIAIAKEAILSAYELPPDALDEIMPVADLYVTEQRPEYRRWNVQFKIFREGSDNYLEQVYTAIVDENGEVIADPDISMPSVAEMAANRKALQGTAGSSVIDTYMQYVKQAGNVSFQFWPLELKAEYSQDVAPQVRAIVQSGDLSSLNNGGVTDLDVIAFSSYTYGIPQANDITLDDAFDIAQQTVMENYQIDSETVALYDSCYVYFDITNSNAPLWKIVFWPSYTSAEKFPDGFASGQGNLRYKIEINSRTGEVTKAEAFAFQALGGDLEYKLKLY